MKNNGQNYGHTEKKPLIMRIIVLAVAAAIVVGIVIGAATGIA